VTAAQTEAPLIVQHAAANEPERHSMLLLPTWPYLELSLAPLLLLCMLSGLLVLLPQRLLLLALLLLLLLACDPAGK
jgi:hypothetical protein